MSQTESPVKLGQTEANRVKPQVCVVCVAEVFAQQLLVDKSNCVVCLLVAAAWERTDFENHLMISEYICLMMSDVLSASACLCHNVSKRNWAENFSPAKVV